MQPKHRIRPAQGHWVSRVRPEPWGPALAPRLLLLAPGPLLPEVATPSLLTGRGPDTVQWLTCGCSTRKVGQGEPADGQHHPKGDVRPVSSSHPSRVLPETEAHQVRPASLPGWSQCVGQTHTETHRAHAHTEAMPAWAPSSRPVRSPQLPWLRIGQIGACQPRYQLPACVLQLRDPVTDGISSLVLDLATLQNKTLVFLLLKLKNRENQKTAVVKKTPANAGDIRDMGSIPGSERFLWVGNGNPLQFLPGKFHRQRILARWLAVHGVAKIQTQMSISMDGM